MTKAARVSGYNQPESDRFREVPRVEAGAFE